jgi:hypothetical protein
MQNLQRLIMPILSPVKDQLQRVTRTAKLVVLLGLSSMMMLYAMVSGQVFDLGAILAWLVAFACQIGLFMAARQSMPQTPAPPPAALVTQTIISPTVVVNEVRTAALVSYGQIGTVKIRKERQRVKGDIRSALLDPFIGEELMIEVGVRVIAGVNLKHLDENDVHISPDGKAAEITLPPTKVFMVYIDESLTQVLWHKKGWLSSHDIRMMDTARREAMESMVNAAIEKGLLEKAGDQAAVSVAGIARSLGIEQVKVIPTLPPIGQHFEELHDPDLRERLITLPLNKADNLPLAATPNLSNE